MPGTRSAPTINGTPDFLQLQFRWIDYVGDKYAMSLLASGTTATPAEIEALAVAFQAASNASLWEVNVTQNYSSVPLKSNALEEVWNDAEDVVVIHYKNPSTQASSYANFPAPLDDIFVEGSEQVDTANALFTGILAAIAAVLPTGFSPLTVRFSKHREINDAELIG
ncbi:MAG: hypothetical protein L0287_28915 [Anaerolineae bacterium]|nr:hypothetical protein [Anaerolineae bacterium]